jgi:outer membrane lipoprotein-sorting protein
MVMRKAGVAALVAALMVGVTPIAVAQSVPVPAPAPKKPAPQSPNQPPRPLAPVGPAATTSPAAAPRPAGGFDATQRALVDRVSGYLSGLQTLVGDFVQVGPDGQRTEGQFFIQKPGKVRFEYNPPSPVDVVADGHSVVVRDRKLDTQQLFSLSQTPLRFLLSDRIDLLKDTNVVSVTADDQYISITIEEKSAIIGTSRLMLMLGAKDNQLKQWTVTDPQGYDTTVAVYNLDTSKKLDPGMFKIDFTNYSTPPG